MTRERLPGQAGVCDKDQGRSSFLLLQFLKGGIAGKIRAFAGSQVM